MFYFMEVFKCRSTEPHLLFSLNYCTVMSFHNCSNSYCLFLCFLLLFLYLPVFLKRVYPSMTSLSLRGSRDNWILESWFFIDMMCLIVCSMGVWVYLWSSLIQRRKNLTKKKPLLCKQLIIMLLFFIFTLSTRENEHPLLFIFK